MSFETTNQLAQKTHRYHNHNNHRSSSTLLVEQIPPAKPDIKACCSRTQSNAIQTSQPSRALEQSTYECTAVDASHELLDYYLNDPISESTKTADAAFNAVEFKLDTLDFSLTKRLLGAVFFLLVIYAWKQYIDDEEESDTIYI